MIIKNGIIGMTTLNYRACGVVDDEDTGVKEKMPFNTK